MNKLWLALSLSLVLIIPLSFVFVGPYGAGLEILFFIYYACAGLIWFIQWINAGSNVPDKELVKKTSVSKQYTPEFHSSKFRVFGKLLLCYFPIFLLTHIGGYFFIMLLGWSMRSDAILYANGAVAVATGLPMFLLLTYPLTLKFLKEGQFSKAKWKPLTILFFLNPFVTYAPARFLSIFGAIISLDFGAAFASAVAGVILLSIFFGISYLTTTVFWHWEVKQYYKQYGDNSTHVSSKKFLNQSTNKIFLNQGSNMIFLNQGSNMIFLIIILSILLIFILPTRIVSLLVLFLILGTLTFIVGYPLYLFSKTLLTQ